jgi:hypothetical protein
MALCCALPCCAVLWPFLQVYGLRPFRIPLRWDFMNISNSNEQLYGGVA